MDYFSRTAYNNVIAGSDFSISFPYLLQEHVDWYVVEGDTTMAVLQRPGIDYQWTSASVIHFTTPVTAAQVYAARNTPRAALVDRLNSPSAISAQELNVIMTQLLFVSQEFSDLTAINDLRTIKAAPGEIGGVLPPAADRKGHYAFFDTITGALTSTDGVAPPAELATSAGAGYVGTTKYEGVLEHVEDYLKEEVFIDSFYRPGIDTNHKPAVERAVAYLVAKNGLVGGKLRTRNGVKYDVTPGVELASGIEIVGPAGLPFSASLSLADIPHFVNTASTPMFTYAPPLDQFDRYVCPSITGCALWADKPVDFGTDEEAAGHYMCNGWISKCFITSISDTAEFGVRLIENYRGGVQDCVILAFRRAIVQKSGDLAIITRNRIWNCDIAVHILSPASTGTQTRVTHNDILKGSPYRAHPVLGFSAVLVTADRWCVFEDNYVEAQTGSAKAYDYMVHVETFGDPISFMSIARNRFDVNSLQALGKYRFVSIPNTVSVEHNRSDKGPTPLSKVMWPGDAAPYFTGALGQREIYWADPVRSFDDVSATPPFQNRPLSAELITDAGNCKLFPGLGGGAFYAAAQMICFDTNTDPAKAEHVIYAPDRVRTVFASYWDIEVDYLSYGGVSVDCQLRNDLTGYVPENSAVLVGEAAIKTKRFVGVLCNALVLDFVAAGPIYGQFRVLQVRYRPSVFPTTLTPAGTQTIPVAADLAHAADQASTQTAITALQTRLDSLTAACAAKSILKP